MLNQRQTCFSSIGLLHFVVENISVNVLPVSSSSQLCEQMIMSITIEQLEQFFMELYIVTAATSIWQLSLGVWNGVIVYETYFIKNFRIFRATFLYD